MSPFLNLEYLFNKLYLFLLWVGPWFAAWFGSAAFWLQVILPFLIILFLLGIVYLSRQILLLRQSEAGDLKLLLENSLANQPKKNARWEQVLVSMASTNAADWKVGIIEADNILDDLVKEIQPAGENLGERLKAIEPSDFLTLQDAWAAHKVRNRIAHEGGYVLTQREANLAMASYKRVFEEFNYL